jgi:2-succinyl-5-enolpyruvyl-6-hydroxy-3-cyclohexene-1-carboxylate synthase
MSRDANTAFARTLVDEWARAGITDACLAPGSRSAPLALALAADPRVRLHVHVDERSAAFFALGCARGAGRPAVVCCTSGTAAAHLHPAVLEAHHGRVPLIVCTADRPPELRDTGAGQTIDQVGLYGSALRWSCDVDPPADREGVGTWWRSLACRAATEAAGPPAGAVHLNLAFREPLAPTGEPLVEAPGRADAAPWTLTVAGHRRLDDETTEELAAAVRATPRGLIVAGWGADVAPAVVDALAARTGWPVLADPLSGLRTGPDAVSTYDALLRAPGFADAHRPELVLHLGAPLTSKVATRWLRDADATWLVDPDEAWLDPHRRATRRLVADADPLLRDLAERLEPHPDPSPWLASWRHADRQARRVVADLLAGSEEPFDGRVARDVVAALPDGASLLVGSSMPVRDVESFAEPRDGVRFVANRGVNGIDGFVSTALGVAATTAGPTVALCGDLTLLHDTNGLLGAQQRGLDVTFVVVDNDGGGIFSFVGYADAVDPARFEQVLATPPGADLGAVAAAHQVPVADVEKASDVSPAVGRALRAGGVRVVRVRTERGANVERHAECWDAVRAAVDPS